MVIDLRDVAAPPWEEDLLVTAQPKGVVDVWSLLRGARCATFETVWCPVSAPWWRLARGSATACAGTYDLTGQRLWQDRSRTNVEAVTALAGGRVVVTYLRRATRVLVLPVALFDDGGVALDDEGIGGFGCHRDAVVVIAAG